MSSPARLPGLVRKILELDEMLGSLGVPHQFGGAIALAWHRTPRATIDIDVNITIEPARSAPVLRALELLGVTVGEVERQLIERDGQARLIWGEDYLDVFFATIELHWEMARRARLVRLGPGEIPILAPEHLVVCKAIFDRPKDWVDVEAMVAWGTEVDAAEALRWVEELLGRGSEPYQRLEELLSGEEAPAPARR